MPSLGRVAVDAAPFTSTQLCEVCLAAAVRARRGPCMSSNHTKYLKQLANCPTRLAPRVQASLVCCNDEAALCTACDDRCVSTLAPKRCRAVKSRCRLSSHNGGHPPVLHRHRVVGPPPDRHCMRHPHSIHVANSITGKHVRLAFQPPTQPVRRSPQVLQPADANSDPAVPRCDRPACDVCQQARLRPGVGLWVGCPRGGSCGRAACALCGLFLQRL